MSVAEVDRALVFYRDALGFTEKYRAGEVVMLGVPGGELELLLHHRPPTPGRAGIAASLIVENVDVAPTAGEKAGGRLAEPPADQPGGERQSVLTDPDGHVICLVAPVQASSAVPPGK